MSAVISATDREKLQRPHVARAWFGRFDFPDAVKYLHSGVGRVTVEGNEYIGVSDPLSGRLVSISQVEEPQFGQAAAVTIVLSGASKTFIQSVHATAREIEGRDAKISWASFDVERQEILTSLVPLFPRGKMSAPSIHWQGIGQRYVSLTIEDIWSTQNYAPGGKWNPAGIEQRNAGDLGGAFIGVNVNENWSS